LLHQPSEPRSQITPLPQREKLGQLLLGRIS
jgi:hypothetical protein